MKLHGKVWKYGDRLAATDVVSAKYDKAGMSRDWAACAHHVLEEVDPSFGAGVAQGDIIVTGEHLGTGHAHYYMTAIMAAKAKGVGAMLAESVNVLFQRAAIDEGFPIWNLRGITELVETGDELSIDLMTGSAVNITKGSSHRFAPLPPLISDILQMGGSLNWAKDRVARKASATTGR